MKKPFELISFFLLPCALAVGLILLREKMFVPVLVSVKEKVFISEKAYTSIKPPISFGLLHDESFPPMEEIIYDSLTVALFVLALVLPVFAAIRNKPLERNEIKLKTI